MLLSVIVPCYNEQDVIEKTWERLTKVVSENGRKEKYDHELIFIDDGSTDGTLDKILHMAKKDSHVKYLSFSRNFGKEAAMYAGLAYASGDGVIIMDADLQHPPELIPKMVSRWKEGYDQVICKRDRKGDGAFRTWSARMYYRLVNHLVDVRMEDGVGDFRLLDRKAVDALLSLTEYNRFSKGLFSWIGFKQTFIRYENHVREGGTSKWSVKRLLRYGIDGIMSFNDKPLRICFWMGGLLFTFGVLYLTVIFIRILLHGVDVPGYFTTIFAILMIGGVQLLSIGVLGEYIGRIYHEVKRRPSFIVDKTNIKDKGKRS